MAQAVFSTMAELAAWLRGLQLHRLLLVASRSLDGLPIAAELAAWPEKEGLQLVRFGDFQPNPQLQSCAAAAKRYREASCDGILAIGGGSALDVAKGTKLLIPLGPDAAEPPVPCPESPVPLAAVPTTAGSGSEATRFAVVYKGLVKQSYAHDCLLPDAVVLDPSLLATLPAYQRKATLLDALCHGIESYWSVHATAESQALAAQAIQGVLAHVDGYLAGEEAAAAGMLRAANLAGQAINWTKTTAGHALGYGLTTRCGLPHGHSVALCVAVLWPWALAHPAACADARGAGYQQQMYADLADLFGAASASDGPARYDALLRHLALPPVKGLAGPLLDELTASVNVERLANHPARLTATDIRGLYAGMGQRFGA